MDTPDSPALAVSSLRPLVQGLPASQIREVANAGMGRDDLIPLWFGEPDEPTPAFIRAVVSDSLGAGETRYTPNAGVPELRDAIATYMEGLYGGPVGRERITVSVSGMNAVMIALQCLIDPGDGLITTGPQWPNLAAVARILDLEAQIPVLERTIAEAGEAERELEGYVAALTGRRREMRQELAEFQAARKAEQGTGGTPGSDGSPGGDVGRAVDRAEEVFNRVMEQAGGLAGSGRAPDRETASRLAELDALQRENRIRERLTAFKAAQADKDAS